MAGITNGILNWPTGVTLTVLQSYSHIGQASSPYTPFADYTGCNLIIMMITFSSLSSTTPPAMIDTNANTYTLVRFDWQGTAPNILGTAIYYCYNPIVGSMAFKQPARSSIGILGISGSNSTPLNANSGSTFSFVTLIEPGSITPSITGCIAVLVVENYVDPVAPSTPAGFTSLLSHGYQANCLSVSMSYQLNVSGPQNPVTVVVGAENFQEVSFAIMS